MTIKELKLFIAELPDTTEVIIRDGISELYSNATEMETRRLSECDPPDEAATFDTDSENICLVIEY
jgi:hypothetical protein